MSTRKIAVVTGAAKGLGLEWCRQLAFEGYQIILTARTLEKAESAAALLREEALDVTGMQLDVEREKSIVDFSRLLALQVDRVDVLINNAGINSKDDPDKSVFMRSFRLADLDPEEVIRHIRVNSIAPVLMVKHLRPLMVKSLHPVVLSISSWLGSITTKDFGGHYSYAASKCALNMMNKAMALELQREGITAVVCNPGWVQTDMGGSKAPLTVEQSVQGMRTNVLGRISAQDTGKFFQWDGSEHPW